MVLEARCSSLGEFRMMHLTHEFDSNLPPPSKGNDASKCLNSIATQQTLTFQKLHN